MAKVLKMSACDRKCSYPNCSNILSIYNHEAYCHIHRDKVSQKKNVKLKYHHIS